MQNHSGSPFSATLCNKSGLFRATVRKWSFSSTLHRRPIGGVIGTFIGIADKLHIFGELLIHRH